MTRRTEKQLSFILLHEIIEYEREKECETELSETDSHKTKNEEN